MRIPKYQWLMQEPNQSCGFCDAVAVTSGFDKHFQLVTDVIDNPELYPNGDFEINPFSEITSTDLSFEKGTVTLGDSFTLYIGGYVLVWVAKAGFSYVEFDNIRVQNLGMLDLTAFKNLMNTNYDPIFGTTTTLTSGTITIADVPAGSYLDNTVNAPLINITTVTPAVAGMYLRNGYYNATTKQINYLNINDGISDSLTLRTDVALEANKLYRFKYGYATIHNFDYTFKVIGFYTPPTATLIPNFSNGLLEFEYEPTVTDDYTLEISFNPENATTAQLAIDNISAKNLEYQTIQTLEVIDCDGVESEIDYATTVYNENILVELLEAVPSVFRLKITDSDDNIFYSRWYSVKEVDECSGLIKVNWTNNCKFSEVDYKNLPFDNELLLTGVKIKQALELHDNVDSINASGAKISIYKNTQASYELRLHPYLEDTQNTIERIFEHTEVLINNEEYNAIDVFQVTEIDLGVYTGRVDLLKKDTEIISSICCC